MDIHPDTRDPRTICERLRGIYNIPVNDGAGPLNGSNIFTREFPDRPPIQIAAADHIEELRKIRDQLGAALLDGSDEEINAAIEAFIISKNQEI